MYTNLRMLMAAKNISIEAMATLLGVHRNTIANKLNGDSAFDFDQAMIIADTLFPEYRPSYIFRRDKSDPQDRYGAGIPV